MVSQWPHSNKKWKNYIVNRTYNSDFGDMVPLILARVYCTNITILDTARSSSVTIHSVCPRNQSSTTIAVHRIGDHYNGIVSKHLVPPSRSRPGIISDSPPAQCDTIACTLKSNDPLPAPWSLDPLPQVTPVKLPHGQRHSVRHFSYLAHSFGCRMFNFQGIIINKVSFSSQENGE